MINMMNLWNQDVSLGIDISDRHISAVLLSRHRDKITVVKAISQRLAASAFGGDSARAAQKIGRTVRQLLLKAGIHQKKAWVSFGSERLLLQIVDIPEQLPGNLGQYIRRQIRNNPLLNSKNPCLDFAAMTKNESQNTQQCLVAAIDPQPIETLVKAANVASLTPQAVDIPIISLCRVLNKKQLSQGYKHHTLLFYLHGQDVYLAVLCKSNLDYIRHLERIPENETANFELWAADQVRAVIQYYEMEFMTKGQDPLAWQFILASESHSEQMETLKVGIEKSFVPNAVYISEKTAAAWLPIEKQSQFETLPLGATGAALRKWYGSGLKTEIDLLPEQARKIQFVTDYFISTAKIAAAIFLVIVLFTYGLSVRASGIQSRLMKNVQADPPKTLEALLVEKKELMEQLDIMKKQKEQVQTATKGYSVECISGLMEQVRKCTPVGIRMTQFRSSAKGTVQIDGYCSTMEEIQRYAGHLQDYCLKEPLQWFNFFDFWHG